MQVSDVLALVRVELGEPDPTGRWSDTDLITLFNTAQRAVGLRIEWPEATLTAQGGTQANVQEYALPEIAAVLRVYVGGQLLTPTTIGNLEGDNLEMWDMTAPTYQPQWIYQSQTNAQAFPMPGINGGNYPVGTSMPWYQGARPQYYMRGGNIGLMPPPIANGYTFTIDVVPNPAETANVEDLSTFPFDFQEALMWKMCSLAHKADNDDEQANNSDMQFEKAIAILNTWKRRQRKARPFQLILFPERAKWKGPGR